MKRYIALIMLSLVISLTAAEKQQENKENDKTTYEKALDLAIAYVYQPVIGNITEKNATRMEIEKLCKLLSLKIKVEMDKFIELGKEAKAMHAKGVSEKELSDKHLQMAEIFASLRPAELMVRAAYPKLNKLFDQLIEINEQLDYSLDYSIPEGKIIIEGTEGKSEELK